MESLEQSIVLWLEIEYRKYDSGVLCRLIHEGIGHSWVGKKHDCFSICTYRSILGAHESMDMRLVRAYIIIWMAGYMRAWGQIVTLGLLNPWCLEYTGLGVG